MPLAMNVAAGPHAIMSSRHWLASCATVMWFEAASRIMMSREISVIVVHTLDITA